MVRFALLLFPAFALAGPADSVHESITALCDYRWPDFPQERHQCVYDQWRAYGAVSSFAATHCLAGEDLDQRADEGHPAAVLYTDCSSRWQANYRALAQCLKDGAARLRPAATCNDTDVIIGLSFAAGCPRLSASIERARRLLRSTDRGKALGTLGRSADLACLH